MIRHAVLFDLDGTLLDTAPDFHTALNRLLADEHRPTLTLSEVRAMVSNGSASLVNQAFKLGAEHPAFDFLRQRLLDYYGQYLLDQTRPFPGIAESLELLSEHNIPWGIVTNKPQIFSQAIIAGLQLHPGALICPEHTGKPKPDPSGILLACSELDCVPLNCLYIGDHSRDIAAGRAAGCKTMAAAYGYLEYNDDPALWGADLLARESAELPELLAEHLA